MKKKFAVLITIMAVFCISIAVQAQDTRALEDIPLQAAGVWENNLYVYGPLDALNITTNGRGNIMNIVWDGDKLAYTQLDENYVRNLWVSLNYQEPFLLVNDLDSMYPASFTPDGQLLFAKTNPNNTQPNANYVIDLYTVKPEIGAVPTFIGSFGNDVPVGVGCGGGSPFPTDWQRYSEVGFGGQSLVLQMTDYGLVHSLDCAGVRTGLLNIETGEDVEIGQSFAIATLSPDGKYLAGKEWNYEAPQLAIVDLETLNVQSFATPSIPDQVIWSADSSKLFYSVFQMTDQPIPMTEEEENLIYEAIGFDNVAFRLYDASIHQYDPVTGDDIVIYDAPEDVLSIGRMFALPDKNVLVFGQIPNMQGWIDAIVSGELDPFAPTDTYLEQIATVPITVFALNLDTQSLTTINVGVNLYTPSLLVN